MAVAQLRGDMTVHGLKHALADLSQVVPHYLDTLEHTPSVVAARLDAEVQFATEEETSP